MPCMGIFNGTVCGINSLSSIRLSNTIRMTVREALTVVTATETVDRCGRLNMDSRADVRFFESH